MSALRRQQNWLAALLLGVGLLGAGPSAAGREAPASSAGTTAQGLADAAMTAPVKAQNSNSESRARLAQDIQGRDNDASEIPVPAGTLDDGRELLPKARISFDEAIAAAQGAVHGVIGEVDLERVGGTLVFNVDVGDKDVKIDAATGEVVSVDADD